MDADGVALAAIQGLNQKLEDRAAALQQELESRDARIQALEAALAELRNLLTPAGRNAAHPPK